MKFLAGLLKTLSVLLLLLGTIFCTVVIVMVGIVDEQPDVILVFAGAWVCVLFVFFGILGTGIALSQTAKLKKRVERVERLEQHLFYAPAAPRAVSEVQAAPAESAPAAVPVQPAEPAVPETAAKKFDIKRWLPVIIAAALVVVALVLVLAIGGGEKNTPVAELPDTAPVTLQHAAEAIMTTDVAMKEIAVEFTVGGKTCKMGGIAKGSGMIHPNLATMLVFITTDAAISPEMLNTLLKADVQDSFNMVSIDGDTSTNDTVAVLANGMAGNALITEDGEDCRAFAEALAAVTTYLCRCIAKDGEGASKLLECRVTGAKDKAAAKATAKAVVCSSLTKAAMFGADANWGRVLCAIGYSGADVDVNKIDLKFVSCKGEVLVCKDGAGVPFSEEIAKEILLEDEIVIDVSLNDGTEAAAAFGCDLTYDYVKINGDYRT